MNFIKVCVLTTLLFAYISATYVAESHVANTIMDSFMNKPTKDIFKAFHFVYNKAQEYNINSEEGLKRYKIFKANLKDVNEHNAKGLSWRLGINQFSDLTIQEFADRYLMKEADVQEEKKFFNSFNLDEYDDSQDEVAISPKKQQKADGLLEEVDHRQYFTPARDQGRCGSCWAFTTAASMEANIAKAKGISPFNLSIQQQIDCNKYSDGCSGGQGPGSMIYAKKGIVPEANYPYTGVKGTCNTTIINDKNVTKYKFASYSAYNNYDKSLTFENWHKELVQGAMYIRVDGSTLKDYSSGIIRYSVQNKSGKNVCVKTTHAVTAAGFGYDNDQMYVLVRNSWGTTWGEQGYFRAYVETSEDSLLTCFLIQYGYRPIP